MKTVKTNLSMTILILLTACLTACLLVGCKDERPESRVQEELEPNKAEFVKEAEPNIIKPSVADVNVVKPSKPDNGFDDVFARVVETIEVREPREPNKIVEPIATVDANNFEALNLKNVEMSKVIEKLAEWTDKVVIPDDELLRQRITIVSPKKIPRSEALKQIYSALKEKGYSRLEDADSIILKPITKAKFEDVPVIDPNKPLAAIEDKSLVVQKTFQLKSYRASQMGQIIQPLIDKHGHISADDGTNTLLVIDTVGNLIRFEKIIKQLDIPELLTEIETEIEIFSIIYGDPAKIVQFLNQLLGEESTVGLTTRQRPRSFDRFGRSSFRVSSFEGSSSISSNPAPQPSSEKPKEVKEPTAVGATSVTIGATKGPIILIPDLERRQIIARASRADLDIIREWIKRLDVEKEVETLWEKVDLKYADPVQVEDMVEDMLMGMPENLRPNVVVQALQQSKQVSIWGSKTDREAIIMHIKDMDVPAPALPEKTIPLKFIDPDEVKEKLEEIYPTLLTVSRGGFFPFGGFGTSRRESTAEGGISVTSLPSQGAVTVRASSKELLEQVVARVQEWDQPIEFHPPRIIELKNTDPIKMIQMLNDIFGGEKGAITAAAAGRSIFDLISGRGEVAEKIIGRLYGKVTFREVPDAKKIIVICTVPEMYDEIEQFVKELDAAEPGEMPEVIVLNYANPWDVVELLNALFNEPGTAASIQRPEIGIEYVIQAEAAAAEQQQAQAQQQQQQAAPGEYRGWWSQSGARARVGEEMPISNVIGRVRFMPDSRSKSVLVLAPPELMNGIKKMISELDKPGKQVMIKAIAVEVDKSKLDSVGLQLASDPTAFTLGENSIRALSQLTQQESHGSMVFGAGRTSGRQFALNTEVDIYALIDFLVKNVSAKIINKQTLWTKDYEAAEFFKGEKIAFLSSSTITGAAGAVTQNYEYRDVGMTLRVRPNITPEKNVDMEIDLSLSQLSQDTVNQQPREPETRAVNSMIVKDGQTVLLGSILTQEDSYVARKIPLLGDAPLVGDLFRHKSSLNLNNELLVFITPTVIDEDSDPTKVPEVKKAIEKMESVQEHLDDINKWLEEEVK